MRAKCFRRDLLWARSPRLPPLTIFGTLRISEFTAVLPKIVRDGTPGDRAVL
jgi:hypothetical protein